MPNSTVPLPSRKLAARVGSAEGADPLDFYLQEGAAVRARIQRLLPPEWTFDGKRVLDFGCGSARVLRHFLHEAERAELWGCDIDGPSIEWMKKNLSPPLRCFQNELEPPLPFAGGYLDLVWATSVFTHIERWSGWLVELHRVLAPDGLLIASFLGEGMWEALVGEPYREDEVGVTVRHHWREGGPGAEVFHSEWWLRAHWGRAFEVLEVARPPRRADGSPETTHSYIVLRRRPVEPTAAALERVDPSDPRELASLQTNLRLQRREIDELVDELASASSVRGVLRRSRPAKLVRRVRRRLRRGR